jgi:hypothetical protein
MINNHTIFFADKFIQNTYCGNNFFFIEGTTYQKHRNVSRTAGTHNLDSCKDCYDSYLTIANHMKEHYSDFPNCCEHHSKLKNQKWFKKEDFDQIPWWIADKVMFSYHHILNYIDDEEWYSVTTNYLEYIIESFGSVPKGFGEPVFLSKYFAYMNDLRANFKFTGQQADKIDKIYNYLEEYQNDSRKEKKLLKPESITILLQTYEKWLNLFPFDIIYFQKLKSHFQQRIPIFKEISAQNPFTKTSVAKLYSQKELIISLLELTKKLLGSIDSTELVRQNLISDVKKHQVDLLLSKHKIETSKLVNSFIKKEMLYVSTINKWLKLESKLFFELDSLIKTPVEDKFVVTQPTLRFFKLKGLSASIKEKAIDLHSSLVTKQYLNEECKKDFIKLFTGNKPEKKISWLGQKGELKSFIDFLLSQGKIENCQASKWQITAANFKFGNDDFTANTIKDTKKPKNDIKLKQIVQNIS